jgi:hypothetical protein
MVLFARGWPQSGFGWEWGLQCGVFHLAAVGFAPPWLLRVSNQDKQHNTGNNTCGIHSLLMPNAGTRIRLFRIWVRLDQERVQINQHAMQLEHILLGIFALSHLTV